MRFLLLIALSLVPSRSLCVYPVSIAHHSSDIKSWKVMVIDYQLCKVEKDVDAGEGCCAH